MSQKAVKDALAGKANTSGVYSGLSVGTTVKATQDANGNIIANTYFKTAQVKTAIGTSDLDVMSQKTVTDALAGKANTAGSYPNLSVGTSTKASQDENGNKIANTYVKNTQISTITTGVVTDANVLSQKATKAAIASAASAAMISVPFIAAFVHRKRLLTCFIISQMFL